jgi:hypothetical protein
VPVIVAESAIAVVWVIAAVLETVVASAIEATAFRIAVREVSGTPAEIASAIAASEAAVAQVWEIVAAVLAATVDSTEPTRDRAAVAVRPASAAAVAVALAVAVAAVVAAASAVVVAVAAAAVDAAAVAEDVGGEIMKKKNTRTNKQFTLTVRGTMVFSTVAIVSLCLLVATASAQPSQKGKGFSSPQEAADSLIAAASTYDEAQLKEILGPASWDIIHTGEPARDKENSMAFAEQARAKMNVEVDSKNRNRATLIVGTDDWPFPVPLLKVGKAWHFDVTAGRQELLRRRVGRNELDAIQICRGYVEAQHEYALAKKENGVNQYAQRIISTPGQQDGLAWRNADGTWDGPIGEKVAQAIVRGYTNRNEPYHGYFFKVLKGQGPAAPLGELDYVIKGVMIGGFALIASPAQYRNTGVKSFMVSQDGVVYEKDLGPNTLTTFQSIDRFNPDRSWTPVKEDN